MTDSAGRLTLAPPFLRRLESLSLGSRRRLGSQGQGERRSHARGSSLQLVDYRSYSPGDDLRQVDWNVYGRSGELWVRLYEDERSLTVHLLIDVSQSMDYGVPNKRAAALGLASALAYVTLSGYDRLQVGFLADRVVATAGPFWGRHQRSVALGAIAAAPRATRTDVAAGIGNYLDRVRQPALLVLVSDLLSPTAADGVRRLASGRHEATILHLLSPEELDPELAEDVQLVDRETGQSVDVSLDLATLATYRQRLADWSARLGELCRGRDARYLRLSTAEDLERSMLQSLIRQGVLA